MSPEDKTTKASETDAAPAATNVDARGRAVAATETDELVARQVKDKMSLSARDAADRAKMLAEEAEADTDVKRPDWQDVLTEHAGWKQLTKGAHVKLADNEITMDVSGMDHQQAGRILSLANELAGTHGYRVEGDHYPVFRARVVDRGQ